MLYEASVPLSNSAFSILLWRACYLICFGRLLGLQVAASLIVLVLRLCRLVNVLSILTGIPSFCVF